MGDEKWSGKGSAVAALEETHPLSYTPVLHPVDPLYQRAVLEEDTHQTASTLAAVLVLS